MKQLTVFCSADLESRVLAAFKTAGVEGFFRLAGGSGHRTMPAGRVPGTVEWEATCFMVPGVDEPAVRDVVEALRDYAGACDIEPCLRIVVAEVEQVY